MKQTTIEQTIRSLISAADAQDAERASTFLSENFRVILHQFPQPGLTTMLDKPTYLQMMRQGKIGGEVRQVNIEAIHTHGAIASAIVTSESASSVFNTHYQLIQDGEDWKIITDMPVLTKKGNQHGA